jgi:DNA-binding PadR family transcriptional regulator
MTVKIGEFEELILLTLLSHGGEAYGADVLITLEDEVKRPTSMGALFTTLDRMCEKGLITQVPTPAETDGKKPRRKFKLQGLGRQAINEAEQRRLILKQRMVAT